MTRGFDSDTARAASEKRWARDREMSALAAAQRMTTRKAWRALIADPTDENRAIFVAACERAR